VSQYNKSQPVIHDQLKQAENKSSSIGTSDVTITFTQEVNALELVNHSDTAIIYIDFSGPASTATGLPIHPHQYYSCNRKITSFSVISDTAATDVRIMGHFDYEALN